MLYLASASSRRAELLQQIGVQFRTVVANIDESARPGESAEQLALRLSREKALAASQALAPMQAQDIVLAADTLIDLDGEILGKPRSIDDCCAMLRKLARREHRVISAVAVLDADRKVAQQCSINRVRFGDISDEDIAAYCASDEPLDKAGGYAIQGKAAIFIEHLSGSYSSVMGLPLYQTAQLLRQFGIHLIA